ncbi:MAG: enolase C-terminal domain-like protein [bacterium]
MPEPRIFKVKLWQQRIPLRQPYRLAGTTLTELDAALTTVYWDDGEISRGEVTPLVGYHRENVAEVIKLCALRLTDLAGATAEEAREMALSLQQRSRCAASLLLCALDNHELSLSEAAPFSQPIPLVAAVASHDPDFEEKVIAAFDSGFQTLKVKVGRNLFDDLLAVRLLGKLVRCQTKVRFDANRAYKLQEAQRFADTATVNLGGHAELLEQPLSPPEWTKTAILARQSELPIMLDESINGRSDVRRAADSGCALVKLKLCKQGGVRETRLLAEYARELGLGVVLGNGVATDISNILELHLYADQRQLFHGACEANGFAKLHEPLRHTGLRLEAGAAFWRVDSLKQRSQTVEERGYVRQS